MKQLMALAFSLILFATYATSQCSNASMRGIFYHCTSCGGGVVFIQVCSGGGGKCDAFRSQIHCGICYVGSAGTCLSSAALPTASQHGMIDDSLTSSSGAASCALIRQGTLQDWVNSRRAR